MKALFVFGTRPEAIKLIPIVQEIRRTHHTTGLEAVVCLTAQHRQMLDQVMQVFGVEADYDLNLMKDNQSLSGLAASVLSSMEAVLQREKPDWVVVQGDTTTVAAAAMVAYYSRCKVAHVEAGLRTHDKWQPFPEEINRRIAGVIADLHLAPTKSAMENLLKENVPPENIHVTGNSVIDALLDVAKRDAPAEVERLTDAELSDRERIILVTAHRRENFGEPLQNICLALKELACKYGDKVRVIMTVHMNPNVQGTVHDALDGIPNVTLIPPQDYVSMVHLMKRAYLILTDSGGIQEEAPSLGKPVLVLRDVTERPEAIEFGAVKLVGTDSKRIISEATNLIDDTEAYTHMAKAVNPYGDGKASERIAAALLGVPMSPFVPGSGEVWA